MNATSCVVGGGAQVASGFLNYLFSKQSELLGDFAFAISDKVASECPNSTLRHLEASGRLIITRSSPGSLISGRLTRKQLRTFSAHCNASRVFTVLGPSYVNFGVPEYMGFADAFAYDLTDEAYTWHPLFHRIYGRVIKRLKTKLAAGAARYWVEAPFARQALANALGIPESRITVIPNCVNSRLFISLAQHHEPAIPTFFFLAAGYWHKNHMILPQVLRDLCGMRPGVKIRVITTLPFESPIWRKLSVQLRRVGLAEMVINLGPLDLRQVAAQLSSSTVVMQISLLETFSATYLEAMASDVPLLVSDRTFAREVCGSAALYADPLNPMDIARKMLTLIDDIVLRDKLVHEGRIRLGKFPDADAKNEKLLEFCTQ